MKIRVLLIVASLAAITTGTSCKKSSTSAPIPTRVLNTNLLEGNYLWHKSGIMPGTDGKDSNYTTTLADGIRVLSDTELYFVSEIDYNNKSNNIYLFTSSNDSEIVYAKSGKTLTFKKKRNLLIWKLDKSTLFGVPDATSKWGNVNKKRMDTLRHWQYIYQYVMTPTATIENSDTLANAAVLFRELLDNNTSLGGADSTGSIYEVFHMKAGPFVLNLGTRLQYWTKENKIDYLNRNNGGGSYVTIITKYKTL